MILVWARVCAINKANEVIAYKESSELHSLCKEIGVGGLSVQGNHKDGVGVRDIVVGHGD